MNDEQLCHMYSSAIKISLWGKPTSLNITAKSEDFVGDVYPN